MIWQLVFRIGLAGEAIGRGLGGRQAERMDQRHHRQHQRIAPIIFRTEQARKHVDAAKGCDTAGDVHRQISSKMAQQFHAVSIAPCVPKPG